MFGSPTKKFAKPGSDAVGSYQVMKHHVMLCCDLNDERSVTTSDQLLEELGKFTMPVHLNVKRNPSAEVIKHAVESSWCILCMLTESFEHSADCKLQVMYALQHNVPIIPIRLQGLVLYKFVFCLVVYFLSPGGEWRQSSWLGDATVGRYWVDFSDDCSDPFDVKVHNITIAVKHVTGLEFSGHHSPPSFQSECLSPFPIHRWYNPSAFHVHLHATALTPAPLPPEAPLCVAQQFSQGQAWVGLAKRVV